MPICLNTLSSALPGLSQQQIECIQSIACRLTTPGTYWRNPVSDIVSEDFLEAFGDILRIHHCLSKDAFSKDKFEYAMEQALSRCGVSAKLADKCNPGHDITIMGIPVSLKTQADRSLKVDKVHISKFMELGKGVWGDKVEDLHGLRDSFFRHMAAYQRIFTLRTLSRTPKDWHYELVEIPKSLLQKAANGSFEMCNDSTQFPKPGYCRVFEDGELVFELYFDGGGERKLQIKNLRKGLCTVHGEWKFAC
ncbi:type II restriction endonuclease [Geotalea daltonii FRC-32]|uniref:Type II restriction endonuclease n=1 Tax=Geotalea daltonii (strain DSM 22248 / JCM 15807 / FRC-32) TaxID=316067 RepID=B9M0B3_GEODF|nr:hypothetical protein [Geotalea daltonii]ACM18950.1 type II restriction endonuclease [Geotalea daltonii FRC-32]